MKLPICISQAPSVPSKQKLLQRSSFDDVGPNDLAEPHAAHRDYFALNQLITRN
jgi:hypothetical protein